MIVAMCTVCLSGLEVVVKSQAGSGRYDHVVRHAVAINTCPTISTNTWLKGANIIFHVHS
jgi:hypothetical protein